MVFATRRREREPHQGFAYQADVFNYCEKTHKLFAIGADQDAAVKAVIAAIPEREWKTFRDGEIAETVHCLNKTDKAFRLIVLRPSAPPRAAGRNPQRLINRAEGSPGHCGC
jgi:hypothetical protein